MELRSNGTVLRGLSGNRSGFGHREFDDARTAARLDRSSSQRSEVADFEIEVELVVVDRGDERWSFGVRHGVLHARRDVRTSAPVGVISSIAAFAVFATGSKNFDELIAREDFEVTGDLARLRAFAENLDVFDFGFEIVLP